MGPDEDALEGQPDAVLEPVAFLLGLVVELQEALDLLGLDRAAEGPVGEPGDDLAGGLARRQVGRWAMIRRWVSGSTGGGGLYGPSSVMLRTKSTR